MVEFVDVVVTMVCVCMRMVVVVVCGACEKAMQKNSRRSCRIADCKVERSRSKRSVRNHGILHEHWRKVN